MTAGERVFRALLRLYPVQFRERFGDEMLAMYAADAAHDDARWGRIIVDACTCAIAEHVRVRRMARNGKHLVPSYEVHPGLSPSGRGDGMLATIGQDARYAMRGMLRQKAFTLVVLATLALGIGANTAIFSVVNGILLRPLPFPEANRIVHFVHGAPFSSVSEGEFVDYRRDLRSFEKLAAFSGGDVSLTSGDEPTRVQAVRVSPDFFDILGAQPVSGRLFSADEYRPGGARVALISEVLWHSAFGSDSSMIGKDIMVSGRPIRVIGILAERFDYPSSKVGLYVPMRLNPDSLQGRNNHFMEMIGRLAPSASVASARTEANTLASTWNAMFPDIYGEQKLVSKIETLDDSITGGTRPFLIALLGAVGFVLLIACVNVANLFLARGESRRKEVAIRSALGASPGRLSLQFVTESLFFAFAGGALGLLIAYAAQKVLVAVAPPSIPRLRDIRLDSTVFLFTGGLVVATGILFGLYPALRIARSRSAAALRDGGRTATTGAGLRLRRALVVSEVALAVVMLAGAGLMLRSLWKLQQTDLGYNTSNVLTARVTLSSASYHAERTVAFYDEVTRKLSAIPGVVSAAAARSLPIVGGGDRWSIMVDGLVLRTIAESPSMAPQQVTPGFFRVMSIPLVSGREFTEQDRLGAPMVTIVNEEMARALWKGANPVGHTIKMFDSTAAWATVVGVVKDTRSEGLTEPPPPTMYFPHAQASRTNYSAALGMTLVIKTSGRPEAVVPALRQVVRSVDPSVPITEVQSMHDVVAASIGGRSFSTGLLLLFAVLALSLAGIGIYGVIAFSVSLRTYEIGVRVALGAQRSSVIGLVLRQSMEMTMVGVIVGLFGAMAVTRAVRSMLVGVTSYDPVTFTLAAAAILLVAVLAGVVPVRRALRVDPVQALRGE